MEEPRSGGEPRDKQIRYKRSNKSRAFDSPGFLPALAAIFLALVAASVWFFWRSGDEDAPPAAKKYAPAVSSSSAPPEKSPAKYFISLARSEFYPGEIITANVSGVPARMIEERAMIGVRPAGSGGAGFLSWEYVTKRQETIRLRAPAEKGGYEIAGFAESAAFNDPAIAAPFTVSADASGAYSVTLGKTEYLPGAPIEARFSGISRSMLSDNVYAGIYKAGAPPGESVAYEYVRRADQPLSLRAPLEPGAYELRGFSNGEVLTEATTAARLPFTVKNGSGGAFALTAAKTSLAPGEEISIIVEKVPKYMTEDGAVVAICAKGARDGQFAAFQYIGGAEGEYVFKAPEAPGDYEIRAYTRGDVFNETTRAARAGFSVSPKR
jgi:hypothetical protein